jgi:DNA-binding beta-propeller fold protein YncE
MTLTSPDEDGKCALIGDANAVDAGALVHAVNTSQAIALKIVNQFENLLVNSAQAQGAFPEICTRPFHACVFAGSDGSFEISLEAAAEDAIAVEVIDNNGFPISEKASLPIPPNVRLVSRPVQEVAVLSNVPIGDRKVYAFAEADEDHPKGLVTIFDRVAGGRTLVEFNGVTPVQMEVATETRQGVIADFTGNMLNKVDLTSNNFDAPVQLPLIAPSGLALNPSGSEGWVCTADHTGPDPIMIQKVDVIAMTEMDELFGSSMSVVIAGASPDALVAITHTSFTTTSTFDLLGFVGRIQLGGPGATVVGLANGSSMRFLAIDPLPVSSDPQDIAFLPGQSRFLVTDRLSNRIFIYGFTTTAPLPSPTTSLTLEGEVADPLGALIQPLEIFVHPTNGFAFVTARNGNEDHPDSVVTIDLTSMTVVDSVPVGRGNGSIAYDVNDDLAFIGSEITRTVISWGLADLLP